MWLIFQCDLCYDIKLQLRYDIMGNSNYDIKTQIKALVLTRAQKNHYLQCVQIIAHIFYYFNIFSAMHRLNQCFWILPCHHFQYCSSLPANISVLHIIKIMSVCMKNEPFLQRTAPSPVTVSITCILCLKLICVSVTFLRECIFDGHCFVLSL